MTSASISLATGASLVPRVIATATGALLNVPD